MTTAGAFYIFSGGNKVAKTVVRKKPTTRARKPRAVKVDPPAPVPAPLPQPQPVAWYRDPGNLIVIALAAVVLWLMYDRTKAPDLPHPNPVPVVAVNPAAAMPGTLAALQAENYARAAARLRAGDGVVVVNEELLGLNKAAIDAAYLPLDEYFEATLQEADATTTATVYEATAKELRRAAIK